MGKLEAVRTTESFAELIEKSGILTVKQLEQAKKACEESADLKTAARRMVNEKLITLWQANQLLRGNASLMRFKFKLLDELGGGRLGRVFLAEHGQLGRRVVLKTLSGRHKNDPEAVKNFLSQARDVAALDHRNLIHIYDIGSEGDQYYVVTEYAEGMDLGKMVAKQGPLPIERAVDLIRQAAVGLAHSHERGVWHCDLKPSNLLIDQQNTLKILDIGVARLSATVDSQPEESAPEDTTDFGSFFRAPEQQAHKNDGGAAADIYSLGGVLYYLLTGRPPLARPVDGKWARDEQLSPLESLRADVPEEIRDLCTKMLQRDPQQRLQSASEVAKSTETWQAAQTDPSALGGANAETPSAGTAPPPPVQTPAGVGSFTPKSGPPPIRKVLPKAKLLVAKPLTEEVAETPPQEDSSVPIADSSPAISVEVSKPAPKKKKSPSSENIPAPSEEPSFSINVGKSTTKNKKSSSNENVATANDESVNEPSLSFDSPPKSNGSKGLSSTKTSAKKKSSKAGGSKALKMPPQKVLIIAGSAAAVFMVLLLSGVTYWMMSGGKPKTVAKVTSKAGEVEKVEKEDEAKTDEKKMPEETPAVSEPKSEPKVEEPAKKDEKPEELTSTDTKKPETPEPLTPADPLPASTPVTALKPDISTPDPPPVVPKPLPEAVAVNTPPPPKPAVVDPFVGFASEIDLPPLGTEAAPSPEALKPLELGTLTIDKKALCIMQLLGNDFAHKGGKQKYAIEAGDGGTSLRDWEIFFRDAAAENGGTKIAAIGLHDNKLTFTWQKEAIAQKASPNLGNCILHISAGPKSRSLNLRKAVVKEPFTLDLNKPTDKRETWKIPFAPDPKKIQIRLTVEGMAAKHRFDPKNVIDADKDMTLIAFGENDADLYLKLKVSAEMKRDLDVSFAPFYQLTSMQKPEKLTVSLLKSLPASFKNEADMTAQQVTVMKSQFGNRPPPPPQQQVLAQLDEKVRVLRQSETQAGQLSNLIKALSGATKIHYEVVYKTDSKELVLITTHPPDQKGGLK